MTDDVAAVLFDVDGTLCTYRQSGRDLLARAFETVGVEQFFTAETYHDRYSEFLEDSGSVRELRRRCFAAIARECGRDPALGRRLAEAYASMRDHAAVDPTPGARAAVERMRRRHRVGVVTNGSPEVQPAKLDALGLSDAFEVVVHAGYDTPAKPAPDPFHAALEALSTPPSAAVYVGNSLSADVAGAHNAGLRSVWYAGDEDQNQDSDPGPDPSPDYRVDSLAELETPPWE